MSSARLNPDPAAWLGPVAARETLLVSHHTLGRLAREGRVRTLRVPWGARRVLVYYSRADVEALSAVRGP